jgi:hypothetical protein
MDVFVVRCLLGDLDAMVVVEVSVKLVSRRRSNQNVGVRPAETRRPAALARPAMMCG